MRDLARMGSGGFGRAAPAASGGFTPRVCIRPWAARGAGAALLAGLALACAGPEPSIDRMAFSLAEPGPWRIPPLTLEIGDTQLVPYTGAGPWIGEDGCGGSLRPGTAALRDYLHQHFPQAYSIGGYSCRPIVGNSSAMSVHATGRALDIMIHTIDGEANNSQGDPIGNWFIENAELIGAQYIIWDRWTWRADRGSPKDREYTGTHPHHDHLHVELSVEAAELEADFFRSPQGPPTWASCGTVPPEGAIIDDGDMCAGFYGPSQYWRAVDGVGYGGALLWTNAFEAEAPSNWGRWNLDVEEAGRYRVEVYLTPPYAVFDRAHYEISHAGEVTIVHFDQGQASAEGWYLLGEFEFAAGSGQHVSLFDHADVPIGDDEHVTFDALRIAPAGDPLDPLDPSDPSDPRHERLSGGCAAGGSGGGATLLAALAALVALRTGRRDQGKIPRSR